MAFGDVDITEGAGTPIATDLISGRHHQRNKLMSGREGVTDSIGDDDMGSSLRSLWVSPRSRIVKSDMASSGLTTATTAYSAGDVVGAGWSLANAVDAAGGTGKVRAIRIVDKADMMTGITLWLATASITFGTDNAGPSVSDADALKIRSSITLGFSDLGGCRVATVDSIVLPYECDATTLYVYAITNVGHTFYGAATDLPIWFLCEKD